MRDMRGIMLLFKVYVSGYNNTSHERRFWIWIIKSLEVIALNHRNMTLKYFGLESKAPLQLQAAEKVLNTTY